MINKVYMRKAVFRTKPAIVALAISTLMSCSFGRAQGTPDPQLQPAVRAYLVQQLQTRLPGGRGVEDVVNEDFRSIPSQVLRGVVYHWVDFPLSTHGEIMVAVAELNGELVPLENGGDWDAIAWKAGWSRVQANPVRACEERVQNAGPRRSPIRRPILYLGHMSLNDRFTIGAAQIVARASPPHVSGTRNNRTVTGWFLESGRIARYNCQVGPRQISLSLLETVPDIGLMSPSS